MEELQIAIKAILPTLEPTTLDEIVTHLQDEVGVSSPEDLKYIEDSDIPMLKPIQRRKLLAALKKGRLVFII